MDNSIEQINTHPPFNHEDELFYSLFQYSMIGQVVVNKNLEIQMANNQIFQCFQLGVQDAAGRPFGDVFHCIKLKHSSHKCGEATRCKNCGVWRSVRETLFCDAPVQSVIQYSFTAGRRRARKWFQLNCGKVTWHNEQYAALVFIDISEMKRKERHLRTKLTLDLATGTLNKTSLMSALQQLTEPDKTSGNFTVCMIDFDHFKVINDRYGHLMGDKVLEVFSDITRNNLRSNDVIGRYGGEEFIFIFYETGQRQALQILKRIHCELQKYFSNEIEVPVTFSAGAIHVEAVSGLPQYTDLIGDVDKLLYRAKRHGRGRVVSSMGEMLFTSE
ncbi:MAG TPA: GGDEF domain-containing protein [Anaerovoracaceae bacterium]|nr:GGDEF domain-containing protein [Anaerovoracaceae bacterium]